MSTNGSDYYQGSPTALNGPLLSKQEYAEQLAREALDVPIPPTSYQPAVSRKKQTSDYNQVDTSNRFVPANPEAEQAVLGSILIDPDAIVEILGILEPGDFYQQKNAWIYQAIIDLARKGAPADFVTVTDALEQRKQIDEIGGAAYVMDLINAVPTAIHVEHYAHIVERTSVLRKLIRAAGQIAQLAYETNDADKACVSAIELVEWATHRRTEKEALTLTQVLEKTVAQSKENARTKDAGGQICIPFGIKKLDEAIGGMWPGGTVILAAGEKTGKTAFTIGVAHKAALAGHKGAIFSLEMKDTQVGERVLSPVSGYEVLEIRTGEILDWDALETASKAASSDNLFIDDSAALTMAELMAKVKRIHMKHDLEFIVVDYVQLMTSGQRNENRTQELAYISRNLKALAKDLNIAVVAVAQLNRDSKNRSDKKPISSDLEGSGQWGKDADAVIFLYREEMNGVLDANPNEAKLIISRARNGPTGEWTIGWDGRHGQFTDEPKPLTADEQVERRKELALKCQSLPLTWDDWKLHLLGPELVRERALAAYKTTMSEKEKALVKPLIQSWKNGHPDMEALVSLDKLLVSYSAENLLFNVLCEVQDVSHRMEMLRKVQEEVVPALIDKRFAIFSGQSNHGKTHMARILQNMVIHELGQPAVWLNWRKFLRDIKETYNGNGQEGEVWKQSRASVLILDDFDKITNEFSTQQLYDVLDEAMELSGTPRAVVLLLNHTPAEWEQQLKQHGYLGDAVSSRALHRSRPVWCNFAELPEWDFEAPGF